MYLVRQIRSCGDGGESGTAEDRRTVCLAAVLALA